MITCPESPMLPPPIARRSTPRAARASARVAMAPGSFFNWTTNWLAMVMTVLRARVSVAGILSLARCYGRTMIETDLPPAVAAALRAPTEGDRFAVEVAGISWSALAWGDPGARPLLLLHGVTSSAATWWRIGPALAATGRQVVAVDLPGHGMTGHWQGHHRFRDNAADVADFVRSAGLGRTGLQVVGHSCGAVTAAALPVAGLRPATLILVDPPALRHAAISREAASPTEQTYTDIDEARAAVRAANLDWDEGDVRAKAMALTQLDEAAARSVLLDNGDWDGGLSDLADTAAAGIPTWIVRGEPAAGSYLGDEHVPAFAALIGAHQI